MTAKSFPEQLERNLRVVDRSRSTQPDSGLQPRELRVGVLLSVGRHPLWILALLSQIEECPALELVPIMVDRHHGVPSAGWRSFLFNVWKRFDAASLRRPNFALCLAEMPRELKHADCLHITSRLVSESDLDQLKAAKLDVILSLDQDDLIPQLLDTAAQGVWSFSESHGNHARENAVWDILEGRDVSTAAIIRHTRRGREVLSRYVFACDPWSLARHQNRVCSRWPTFAMQMLLNCSQGMLEQSDQIRIDGEEPGPPPLPGNLRMLKFLTREFGAGLLRKIRESLFQEQWFMGIRDRRAGNDALRLEAFKLINAPPGHFYADPFIFETESGTYLFFEDYVRRESKGIIGCIQIGDSGLPGEPKVVLETDYHLSYPTIFEWEGQIYMLPETRDSGRISLFRAVEFPWRWRFDRVLIDSVWAVDPTVFEHDGKFWMFAGGVERHGLIDGELFLFFSDSPFGPWWPHPRNPVVVDARRARPAGQVFTHQGQLVRPGQDCARRYGRAVTLNRIEVLSETDYVETPFHTMEPDWFPGNIGTHTFNQSKNYQVVDGRFYSLKFPASVSFAFWNRAIPSVSLFKFPRRA